MTDRHAFGWTDPKTLYGEPINTERLMYTPNFYERNQEWILPIVAVLGISAVVLGGIVFLAGAFGPSDAQLAQMHKTQVIQEIDDCKIYRFYDGNYHYVTRCGDKVTTQKNWNESCGKACIRRKTEELITEDNQ